jgi:ribonuclease HIII
MNEINNAIAKHQELYYLLSPSKFIVSEYREIPCGVQFFVQKDGWSGSIKIYQHEDSNVKIDFSQLDKSKHSTLIKSLAEAKKNSPPKKPKNPAATDRKIALPAIGCDLAGKADYFGSLVIAAVYIDRQIAVKLSMAGVQDIRNISDTKIEVIARKIREICQDKCVVVEISPPEYNQLYNQLEIDKRSLNDLLIGGYARAIDELLAKVRCETAIVDKLVNENLLLEHLQRKGREIKVIQDRQKTESHLAISAASILAKDRLISNLRQLGKHYQVELPKGSAKAVITAAKQLVATHGIEVLGEVAKLHFKTTKELLI